MLRLRTFRHQRQKMSPEDITALRVSDQVPYFNFKQKSRTAIRLPDMSADIREAARDAVRHMITLLGVERGLSRVEAYMLCSVAGDLRMHEVVSDSS